MHKKEDADTLTNINKKVDKLEDKLEEAVSLGKLTTIEVISQALSEAVDCQHRNKMLKNIIDLIMLLIVITTALGVFGVYSLYIHFK